MVAEYGRDFLDSLMKVKGFCTNCGTSLTFEESARLAKDNGVSEDAVMCPNCKKVFKVKITPEKMTVLDEIKKYDFSDKKQEAKSDDAAPVGSPEQEIKSEVKPQSSSPKQEVKSEANAQAASPQPEVQPVVNSQVNAQTQVQNNNVAIQQKTGSHADNGLVKFLFYKTDAEYGLLRWSKTKIISELWFVLVFVWCVIGIYTDYFGVITFFDIIGCLISAFIFTIPALLIGWVISKYLDGKVNKNNQVQYVPAANAAYNQQTASQNNVSTIDSAYAQPNASQNVAESVQSPQTNAEKEDDVKVQYLEKDNLGSRHDTLAKANAYWLGERMLKEEKDPFTLYNFKSAKDAKDALLELPYIHEAEDTGNLICDDVFIFGYYEVTANDYEAIVCGKDLTYDEFNQAEDSFKKNNGTLKNNLEPNKSVKKKKISNELSGEVKFREKFDNDQSTYECYDAATKSDALNFLKEKDVNQRLYYVCVYTPEGNYGRDIDGIYQM